MSPTHTPTRQEAFALLCQYNEDPAHIRHGLAVEAVMRFMARKQGEDEEKWGIIGLIHDLDYEKFPEAHCQKTRAILEAQGWPEEYIRAALSHGWGTASDIEPSTPLEKTLYAVDELTGLVAACARVRPSRSLRDLEVRSVLKKWKAKAFAAGVDRGLIEEGARRLGVDLPTLISDCIQGMREVACEIGL